MEKFLENLSNLVWGPPLLLLLLGTHVFLTFRLRFIQRYILTGIRISLRFRKEGEGDISQFGALVTALAATIGTGNIIGVATAVAAGGPGAVLWMWLTGVFGIATKYAEALLAVKYRVTTENGSMAGGPMYVLEKGLRLKWLAVLFAVFTVMASFGIGNMVQANSIASLVHQGFGVPHWVTGVILAVLTGMVILGGIKSIARACQTLVPFMALFYIIGCLVLLALQYSTIPASLVLIFKSAFSGQAAVGGFIGAGMREVVRFGIARGLFSNESGLGSAPIVAAAAQTRNPVRQALVSATGTFWDTVVVCALSGLVMVNSGAWQQGLTGPELSKAVFSGIPLLGPFILTVGLLTFVYSTILGWSYYGEKALEYLLGSRTVKPYRFCWILAVMLGAVSSIKGVWSFADIMNGLMALPNLVALILLHPVIVNETRRFLWKRSAIR